MIITHSHRMYQMHTLYASLYLFEPRIQPYTIERLPDSYILIHIHMYKRINKNHHCKCEKRKREKKRIPTHKTTPNVFLPKKRKKKHTSKCVVCTRHAIHSVRFGCPHLVILNVSPIVLCCCCCCCHRRHHHHCRCHRRGHSRIE